MENIPVEYLLAIYAIMALPVIIAIVCVISLIFVAVFYFTDRRKIARKILKIVAIGMAVLIAFAWLTRTSLGI